MFWPPLMRFSCNIYKYADIWCKNKNAIFIVCFQCKRLHLLLNSYSLLSHPMLTRCNSQHKHSRRDDDDDDGVSSYIFLFLYWCEKNVLQQAAGRQASENCGNKKILVTHCCLSSRKVYNNLSRSLFLFLFSLSLAWSLNDVYLMSSFSTFSSNLTASECRSVKRKFFRIL